MTQVGDYEGAVLHGSNPHSTGAGVALRWSMRVSACVCLMVVLCCVVCCCAAAIPACSCCARHHAVVFGCGC